jgi:hypothetical protein
MEPEQTWGQGGFDLAAYRDNRAALLDKAVCDHLVWTQSLAACGNDASLAATWFDLEGNQHTTAVNEAFLQVHLRIVRSLMKDLTRCGPEGRLMVRDIFAGNFGLLRERDGLA